jgi:hemoglobin
MSPALGPDHTPFDRLGLDASRALAERFYDHMDAFEPALVKTHPQGEPGKVSAVVRARFSLFLVEWLGGPRDFSAAHGHPRLRMRHHAVPIGTELRDAWLRCMDAALDHPSVDAELRAFLSRRFAEVADFLRNQPGA